MRAYYFGNMYLSSIQQGIQALHVTSEMYEKYRGQNSDQSLGLRDWGENHKTVVLLNAGFGAEIRDLVKFFTSKQNSFAWDFFEEEEAALDGAITCVGIVLPERIYATAAAIRNERKEPGQRGIVEMIEDIGRLVLGEGNAYGIEGDDYPVSWEFNKWELQLAQRLNNYRLAG